MQGIRRILGTRLARRGLVTTLSLATFVGMGVPQALTASPAAADVAAAQKVAEPFVVGFESASSPAALPPDRLRDLATPELAAQLDGPSQGGAGIVDSSDGVTVTAEVDRFEVVSNGNGVIELLALTTLHIQSGSDTTTTVRLVAVRLVRTPSGWRVADVDGLSSKPETLPALDPGPEPTTTTTAPVSPTTAGDSTPAPASKPATPTAPFTLPPGTTIADIPAQYASLFVGAAQTCPGLPWSVLAGIGKVESNFGRSTLPGVSSGSNFAGAQGPMQFLPATFAAVATGGPGGAVPPNPYDPADAVYSAAKLLCRNGGGNPAKLYSAIFQYNHSAAYVSLVLAYSQKYAAAAGTTIPASAGGSASALASVIIGYARAYLGVPCVWGGESPKGFDCSGLMQWIFAKAGISLPRVAVDQYNAGPKLAAGAALLPGDLVFFGSTTKTIHHVGLYIGDGQMIDAPHTGAVVRVDKVGVYIGATRPAVPDLVDAGLPIVQPSSAVAAEAKKAAARPRHTPDSVTIAADFPARDHTADTWPSRRRRATTADPSTTTSSTLFPRRTRQWPSTTTTSTTLDQQPDANRTFRRRSAPTTTSSTTSTTTPSTTSTTIEPGTTTTWPTFTRRTTSTTSAQFTPRSTTPTTSASTTTSTIRAAQATRMIRATTTTTAPATTTTVRRRSYTPRSTTTTTWISGQSRTLRQSSSTGDVRY